MKQFWPTSSFDIFGNKRLLAGILQHILIPLSTSDTSLMEAIQVWRRFEEALFKHSDSTHFEYYPRCPLQEFASVIAQDGKIIHAGDYVKLSRPFHEVCSIYLFNICSKVIVNSFFKTQIIYGVLLSCFKESDGSGCCIVRGLQQMISPLGQQITDEIKCHLLELFLRRSLSILKVVYVVHKCSSRLLERERDNNYIMN